MLFAFRGMRGFQVLLAVVALALLILVGAKRLGVGRPLGSMQLLGRLPLDARRSVYLVKIGQRVLVLGVSEAGLTKLAQLRADQIPQSVEATSPSFTDVLARLRGRATAPPAKDPPVDQRIPAEGVEAEENQ